MDKLEKYLLPFANKVNEIKILKTVKDAMIMSMPLLIIGSVFLLFSSLPIPGYSEFMTEIFGNGWGNKLTIVTDATFGLIGFLLLITVPYYYCKIENTDPIFPIVLSISSFFVLTEIIDGMISIEWFGSQGMFFNIILSIVVTRLYIFLYDKNTGPKMPDGVPPGVVQSFASLVPILLILSSMLILRILIEFLGFESLQSLVFTIIQVPLLYLGSTLPALLIAETLGQLLWFTGLHGNAIVNGVMNPAWIALSADNLAQTQAGLEPLNIVTKQFKEIYLQMGGSGSTLPLAILLATSKSKQLKTLGAIVLPASLFNINEPLIFGLPIVLNPMFFIPWIINTPIAAIISYFSMNSGLVALTSGLAIPWTTPVLISGYLVSGISGTLLQVVLLIIGFAIYFPFFKVYEKTMIEKEE